MAIVALEGVEFGYPGRGVVLEEVKLEVGEGVTVLVGPNGGGKTTFLRMLAGLVERGKGKIVLGETGKVVGAGELRGMARMVMQDAETQILGASVREDIELGRAVSGLGNGFGEAALRLSERLGLRELWEEPVDVLSYGQKRKLCLLHAMLAGPKMLLLDEPFAGLDYPAAVELRECIRRNAEEGVAQVISTHELEPVFDLADEVVVVSGGRVVLAGRPDEVGPELEKWAVRVPGKGW